MHPKDAERIANSVDPDQTAPLVWSGSALFAQTCLSENLGKLRYVEILNIWFKKNSISYNTNYRLEIFNLSCKFLIALNGLLTVKK